METRGVCLFAYNNDQIDYVKLAVVCAAHIKKHMKNNNVTLITTSGDSYWLEENYTEEELDAVFDQIIISNPTHKPNVRQHFDSPWTTFNCEFKNSNKHEIFSISPYDKTLMIDIDYLVNNDHLDGIFESSTPLAMYSRASNFNGVETALHEQFINEVGIPMWWSTVVYFDKSEHSEMFFDLWAHVAENYEYYSFLYGFPNKLFRTDFCVSIATHILNGMQPGSYVSTFTDGLLINSIQQDDIVSVNDDGSMTMLANDVKEPWKNYIVHVEGMNIHVMNKRAILRMHDRFKEVLL